MERAQLTSGKRVLSHPSRQMKARKLITLAIAAALASCQAPSSEKKISIDPPDHCNDIERLRKTHKEAVAFSRSPEKVSELQKSLIDSGMLSANTEQEEGRRHARKFIKNQINELQEKIDACSPGAQTITSSECMKRIDDIQTSRDHMVRQAESQINAMTTDELIELGQQVAKQRHAQGNDPEELASLGKRFAESQLQQMRGNTQAIPSKTSCVTLPFQENPKSFESYLNKNNWEDGKKRRFFGLTKCTKSTTRDSVSYSCKYGYIEVSDPISSQKCELESSSYRPAVITTSGNLGDSWNTIVGELSRCSEK